MTWESTNPTIDESIGRISRALTDLDTKSDFHHHTFVLPTKVLYVETPKAAATSIKRSLATSFAGVAAPRPVAGICTDDEFLSLADQRNKVHVRDQMIIPSLADLSSVDRDEVLSSSQWLRFCVTRHPLKRLFSAWSSKALLADPNVFYRLPYVPLTVRGNRIDVRSSFRAFVDALAAAPEAFFIDMHFRPQVRVTHQGLIRYDRIIDLSDLDTFWKELTAQSNHPVQPLGRENESLIPLDWSRALDEDMMVQLNTLYGEDLEAFGYSSLRVSTDDGEFLDESTSRLVMLHRRDVTQLHNLRAQADGAAEELEVVRREALEQVRRLRGQLSSLHSH